MAVRGESIFPTDYNIYPITVIDDWVYWVIIDGSGFEVVYVSILNLHLISMRTFLLFLTCLCIHL